MYRGDRIEYYIVVHKVLYTSSQHAATDFQITYKRSRLQITTNSVNLHKEQETLTSLKTKRAGDFTLPDITTRLHLSGSETAESLVTRGVPGAQRGTDDTARAFHGSRTGEASSSVVRGRER